jgi:hypothetical protein
MKTNLSAHAVLLASGTALAQTPNPDLAALRETYADVPAVRAICTFTGPGPGSDDDVVTNAAGQFRMLQRLNDASIAAGSGSVHERTHFVYSDGKQVISSRLMTGTYQQDRIDRDWVPSQLLNAPWPMLPQWTRQMEQAGVVPTVDNGLCTAALTIGDTQLVLSWRQKTGVLESAGITKPPSFESTCRFISSGARFPTQITWQTKASSSGKLFDHTTTHASKVSVIDEPEAARLLAFDAKAQNVNRFDQGSSNVYSPEGKLLYNEKERANALLGKPPANKWNRRGFWIGGIAALAAITAILAGRRAQKT